MLDQVISNFPKQFDLESLELKNGPFVIPEDNQNKIIICGMGGSALAGEIALYTNLPVCLHRSYGLPEYATKETPIVCISYSGNTEETLSAYQKAKEKNMNIACITTGGKLGDLCEENKTPWIKIPTTGIQPRHAIGYQSTALFKIIGVENLIAGLMDGLKTEKYKEEGKKLAQKIENKIPIIYASRKNKGIAKIWKIIFNENSKTPAFWNYFPELNHNEMEGMSYEKTISRWQTPLFFGIILKDKKDHPSIQKRMDLTAQMMNQKDFPIEILRLSETDNLLEKIFSSIILANWTAYFLALSYKVDPEDIAIIEEFKKKLQ